jgi:hypothetical protein
LPGFFSNHDCAGGLLWLLFLCLLCNENVEVANFKGTMESLLQRQHVACRQLAYPSPLAPPIPGLKWHTTALSAITPAILPDLAATSGLGKNPKEAPRNHSARARHRETEIRPATNENDTNTLAYTRV